MKIRIVCIGKLKEKYWQDAVAEYGKRLKSYCDLEIAELKEAPLKAPGGPAEEEAVKREEGESILRELEGPGYVISLEIKGKRLTSEQFSEKMDQLALDGRSEITFVIGGSLGLSQEVSHRADMKLSFSDMTFPHQMMRVILLEQIYRAFRISRGEPYHK